MPMLIMLFMLSTKSSVERPTDEDRIPKPTNTTRDDDRWSSRRVARIGRLLYCLCCWKQKIIQPLAGWICRFASFSQFSARASVIRNDRVVHFARALTLRYNILFLRFIKPEILTFGVSSREKEKLKVTLLTVCAEFRPKTVDFRIDAKKWDFETKDCFVHFRCDCEIVFKRLAPFDRAFEKKLLTRGQLVLTRNLVVVTWKQKSIELQSKLHLSSISKIHHIKFLLFICGTFINITWNYSEFVAAKFRALVILQIFSHETQSWTWNKWRNWSYMMSTAIMQQSALYDFGDLFLKVCIITCTNYYLLRYL